MTWRWAWTDAALILAVEVVFAAAMVVAVPGTARADDDDQVTRDACVGLNLGMTPDQIAEDMRRNDARLSPMQVQRRILFPILEGDCDSQ